MNDTTFSPENQQSIDSQYTAIMDAIINLQALHGEDFPNPQDFIVESGEGE